MRIKKRKAKFKFLQWKRVYREFFEYGYNLETIANHYGFSFEYVEDKLRYGIRKTLGMI